MSHDLYAPGLKRFKEGIQKVRREVLRPPPRLSLSAWADNYGYLSPETSANPGKFRSFPYQRGIMDAVTDPAIRLVTVMKSSRVGYTKCLDHVLGYFVHMDPSPILVVQPRVEDAEDYSRTEIAPMLRDTPVLAAIAGDLKAKDSNQRIDKRMFANGSSISFIGANSPAGFRRITARIVAFDEVDAYPSTGAGIEGDQISLGIKRSETFWNRKIIAGSTPLLKGMSRIEELFKDSDQRHYYVPCPSCGHFQTLKWSNLRWDQTDDETYLPETAHFVCEQNGCVIEESSKLEMLEAGEWRADKPFNGHAGFHLWTAYSLFPNACWANIVKEFLEKKQFPTLLQAFTNQTLGESFEESAERVDSGGLISRVENYGPNSLSELIMMVTAGIDTQGDRLEVQVIGWGERDEAWVIEYHVLWGDPAQQQVWAELDTVLTTAYHNVRNRELRIRAAAIDTGGHHAAQVLAFCRSRRSRHIYPTKGIGGPRLIWPKEKTMASTGDTMFLVGVDTAKEAIFGQLRIGEPGPGYWHFPVGFEDSYFDQLTSERVVTRFREGRPYRVWVLPPGRRNEALDTAVLAMAARCSARIVGPQSMLRPGEGTPFPRPPRPRGSIAHLLAH